MELADILPYEQVAVLDIDRAAPREVCLNGAAALTRVIVITYAVARHRGGPAGSGAPEATFDVLVLGSGVAGLSAAVRAGRGVDGGALRVGVLTKGELSQSATRWAQGGVAAVLGGDEDSTDLHLADTLAAGAGLCDEDAVRVLVDEGPARVRELIALGAVFDREASGDLALAREGGHSRARVVHAGGAATGAEVERALVEATRRAAAAVLEGWFAVDLLVDGRPLRRGRALGADGECGGRGAAPPTWCWPRAAPDSSTR